jgi:4-amino-4-deoxychorismate lyase
MRWTVNGEPAAQADLDDRGFAYGDGIFETIAVRHGVCRLQARHLARLAAGCAQLRIEAPDPHHLARDLDRLAGSLDVGIAKLVVTRGSGPRGYRPPSPARTFCAIGLEATSVAAAPPGGANLRYCTTRAAISPDTAGLKTLNRLEQVLARSEWSSADIHEGLMCDADGWLIGGTMSNVFAVIDGVLLTPELARAGVHGVMRGLVLDVSARLGQPVATVGLRPADLGGATEMFISNSQFGIWPVGSLDGSPLTIGPVTCTLARVLSRSEGVAECAAWC